MPDLINPSGIAIVSLLLSVLFFVVRNLLLPPHLRFGLGKKYVLPKGPEGSPLFGSLLSWLKARNSGRMAPWLLEQAQYGEMTTLSMGTRTWVLLNSQRVLNEIIAKRAGITHERPSFPVAGTLVSRDHRLFLQKTEQWREGRRLLHQLLMGEGSKFHNNLAEEASLGLLKAYLDEPSAWYAHNYRFAISVVYRIVTDTTIRKTRAELEDLQKVTSTFLTSINSSFVDFFPQISLLPKWLQGSWRSYWKGMGDFHYRVFKDWWTDLKGTHIPKSSFAQKTMLGEYGGSDDQAMYIALFAITAGSDNPRMTLNAFIMACIAWPEPIQRMRLELDSICGADANRLPNLNDLSNAPYSSAVVKEVLRWRPTVPLVPQRVLVEDLEFEGHRFPKGTEFLINTLATCMHGFDEADSFKPERWLEKQAGGTGANVEQNLWQYAFSAGRRSCVGYKLAQKEMFIAFSRLVYCLDFAPAGKFSDKELNAFAPGEPFPVKITARSPAHERLIRNEAVKCEIWGS
ncbi:cytochrome P450 [Xylaria nigripes]|nr:cytochrome P450 [Xylaria nigripes]